MTGNIALSVCLAAMDGCWLYLVASFFAVALSSSLHLQAVPSPVVLAGLELLSWGLSRFLLSKTGLPTNGVRVVSGGAGLACTLGVLLAANPTFNSDYPLEWLGTSAYAIIVCLPLWFVGGYRATRSESFDTAYRTFRTGLAAIGVTALLTLVVGGRGVAGQLASMGGAPVWFFVWSMVALILGKREAVREEAGKVDVGSWGLVSAGSIGIVITLGFVGGAFGGEDPLVAVQRVVTTAVTGLVIFVYGVLYAILWPISLLGIKIEPAKTQGVPSEASPERTVEPLEETRRQVEAGGSALGISPDFVSLATWLAIVLCAVGVALLVGRGVRRWHEQAQRMKLEEREDLGVRSRLAQQLGSLIKGVMARFRRAADVEAVVGEDDLSTLVGRAEWKGSLSVRQIYVQLQSVAGKVGYPRAPQVTAVEYLSVLSGAMPELAEDLECITRAYLDARYSPVPVSGPVVVAANDAWKRVERGFRGAGVGVR
ncbi:MAG TPA: DUF4129 domain-containing protein [Chloroflexia bacterium]|jgi:hypothetical protein